MRDARGRAMREGARCAMREGARCAMREGARGREGARCARAKQDGPGFEPGAVKVRPRAREKAREGALVHAKGYEVRAGFWVGQVALATIVRR